MALALLGAAGAGRAKEPATAQASAGPEVKAAEIGKSVEIIGRLGAPLGELITVTASYETPEGSARSEEDGVDMSHFVRVTRVNGKDLPSPVTIRPVMISGGSAPSFPLGQSFEWEGCEMGRFSNSSEEFLKESRKTGPAYQEAGKFGFYTRFVLIKASPPPVAEAAKAANGAPHAAGNRKEVQAGEIGKSVTILSDLGLPIGKMTTLSVILDPARQPPAPKTPEYRSANDRDYQGSPQPLILKVLKVDGWEPAFPLEIRANTLPWARDLKIPVGEAFEVRGCERGEVEGWSEAFVKEYTAAGGPALQSGPQHFATSFTLINPEKK